MRAWSDVKLGDWITDKTDKPWQVVGVDDKTGWGYLRDDAGTQVTIPAPTRPVPIHVMQTADQAIAAIVSAFPNAKVLRDTQ